ncbi:S-adenosyl-L-methionine-dependent methyltransferase [Hygrophoropsis aurantiaca]|uniref:S-adenosyl-L-methionine-dependent methyltransferase n=1 Tax=Hygrophoropsis aurantiaca TaxID=72124 RepID=A0ACB8ANP5_9AGAM|nr:S-adenosyl-L-methionine-dependent methyltransferase [Hygrophoropsis aurantiaca]
MQNITPTVVVNDPQSYEDRHVHTVYDQIATHFSSTRYKPWPIIAQFLSSLPDGWIGLDSGTGNGKYLPLPVDRPNSILTIGLDRSRNLLEIARYAGNESQSHHNIREVVWGDVLGDVWRSGIFDYAISIATIHHLASYERRKLAVQRLIQCVSPKHGRILIYVWAIEQDKLSKRKLPLDDQQVHQAGQDVFVPWVMSHPNTKNRAKKHGDTLISNSRESEGEQTLKITEVYHRYYHMFAKEELTQLVHDAARELGLCIGSFEGFSEQHSRGIDIVQESWERSNYFVELKCWQSSD